MLTELALHYKQSFIAHYDAHLHDTYWFATYDQQIFGIKKHALTEEEYHFLQKLFMPFSTTATPHLSPLQMRWLHFLTATDLPPTDSASRLYVLHIRDLKEPALLMEAFASFFESMLIIPLDGQQFIAIEQQPTPSLSLSYLEQIHHTLLADFGQPLALYIGQYHAAPSNAMRAEYTQLIRYFQQTNYFKVAAFYEIAAYMHSQKNAALDAYSPVLLQCLKDGELAHTLRVFFESNLNSSVASKKLYIHRNSLLYRLDKLLEQTGIDVRQFHQAYFVQQLLYKL